MNFFWNWKVISRLYFPHLMDFEIVYSALLVMNCFPFYNSFQMTESFMPLTILSIFPWKTFWETPFLIVPTLTLTAKIPQTTYIHFNHSPSVRILLVRIKFKSNSFFPRTDNFSTVLIVELSSGFWLTVMYNLQIFKCKISRILRSLCSSIVLCP